MTRRIWIFCLALVLVLTGVPLRPAAAVGGTLTTDQGAYYLGQIVTLTGSGFTPWSAVALSIRYGQSTVMVDQTASNNAGTFTATFPVVPSWAYGPYLALAVSSSGEQVSASFSVIPRGMLAMDRSHYLPGAMITYTGTDFPSGIAKTLFVTMAGTPTLPFFILPAQPSSSTFTGTFLASNGWTPGSYVFTATYPTAATVTIPLTVVPTPPIPAGLVALAGHNQVFLSWIAVSNPYQGGYRVYRSASASGPYSPIGQTGAVTFTDTGATAGPIPYFYVVTSFDNTPYAYASGASGEASATPWGNIHHLAFEQIPSPQTAGVTFPITIAAKDSYDRTVADYGNPAFLSDSTGTIRPLLFTFQNGVGHPTVTIIKAQAVVLITATGSPTGSSNPFEVLHNAVERVVLDPKATEVTADQLLTYRLTAFDAYDNDWAVESNPGASFTILPVSGGSFTGNVLNAKRTGSYVVTGAYGGKNDSGTLTIAHGAPALVVMTPSIATIQGGASQIYTATAFDAEGNGWDVSGAATFTIDAAAGGAWSGSSYTAQKAGSWIVTAGFGGRTGTATLLVTHASPALVSLTPKTATIAAGSAQAYLLTAFDNFGNSWDATPSSLFTIDTAAGGAWSGNLYTAERAGSWSVTASLAGLSDNGRLVVLQSSLDHITLAPQTATLLAGASQFFLVKAFDDFGNAWDATTSATFSIDAAAGGSWFGPRYTAEKAGAWIVTASYGGKIATASLQVNHAVTDRLWVAPDTATIVAGGLQVYASTAYDAYGNNWEATALTAFSVFPDGSVTGQSISATIVGAHVVTGTFEGKSDTAGLTVTPSVLHHFLFSPIASPQIAGVDFPLSLLAMDAYENVKTDFQGTANLTATNGGTTPSVVGPFIQGDWSGQAAVDNPGEGVHLVVSSASATSASFPFTVNPRTLTVTFNLLVGWNQICVPVRTATNPAVVFAGLPSGWLFYAWDPILGAYLDKNHADVALGQAYWLKVNSAIFHSITGQPNLDEETRVPLAQGWNMIGAPYAGAIPWNQGKITDGVFTYTLPAAPAGWILNTGFHYDGSVYQPVAAGSSFQAAFGYWVKAKLTGLSLIFGKP